MPDDAALNPYAPPAGDSAGAAIPGVWRVENDCLIVREGAVLPPVDLDGRGAGGPLTPLMVQMPVPLDGKGLLVQAGTGAFVIAYLLYQSLNGGRMTFLGIMVALVVGQFVFRGVKIRTAPAHVFGYISVKAVRAMTRRARRCRWLLLVSLVPVLALLGLVSLPLVHRRGSDWILASVEWALGSLAISLLLVLFVSIWSALDRGWRCSRIRDGWLWVKGLGPEALARLAARASEPLPVPVKRRVFRARLDLMPPEFWRQVHGRGLAGWWRTRLLKFRHKGPLEQWCFHWSERQWLPPDQADAELLESWQRETAGTPLADWKAVYAELSRSPSGCDQVNEIAFLSPDGRHAAIPALTRLVTGRKLKEVRETNFRSVTRSGRILATGSVAACGPFPAEFDFVAVRGNPGQVAAVHLQRTTAEDLVVMDADELCRLEKREMQLRHEAMEAAGIYGPVEEMEFAGEWA